ncbi:hypothetical protein CDD82_7922 [Ophiocordyceps australis]|uniref:Uncharacterized protein n=1 Tax=Ophiocordyceps australis TaxID=1399860 RepID=A0A2C5YNA0_9HYPO|nr:hypothetical protein CDD82_7922 [Ophiocordyceps australis]
MASPKAVESAAEYGCRTGCFRHHQGQRFSLQRQLESLQDTVVATEPKRLIEQPGLPSCPIPKPIIKLDAAVEGQEQLVHFYCHTPNPRPWTLELVPGLAAIKKLLVPVDELDLASSPELDLLQLSDEVLMKRCWSLSSTWLPMSPVRTQRDEGLDFPPKCRKLHFLLNRELELEQISTSEQSEAFMANEFALQSAACSSILCMPPTRPEAVTPPVSPMSGVCSPFIPGSQALAIDLTSAPSSPTLERVDQLQRNVLQAQIDSDIEVPWSLVASSPVKANATLPCHHRGALYDAHIDVPLACTKSDSVPLPSILENANLGPSILDTQELDCTLHADQGPLDDAILALASARSLYAAKLVAQEKLDPADSLSRLSVPIMDFHFPPPEWMQNIQSSRKQLSWLQNGYMSDFAPLYSKDALLDSSLKWTPVPRGKGHVSTFEQLEPNQCCEELLGVESRRDLLMGMKSASASRPLAILDITADEEIEELELVPVAHGLLRHWTASSSPYFTSHSAQIKVDQSLESLCRSMRRKAQDDNAGQSPSSRDTSGATGKLISDFMHLRAIKRPRLRRPSVARVGQVSSPLQNTSHSIKHHELADEAPKQIPAHSPPFEIPQRVGPCIVSLALDRHMIRQLCLFWPAHLLLDLDYEQYSTCQRVYEEDGLLPATFDLPLTVEADITLSLDTGVMVTTLLKVKQRPLPGSKAQVAIRERTRELSAKYEKLIVLVSENNPTGEFSASHELLDKTAYTEFVGFSNSLKSQVMVHLVPGNRQTLGKWILSLMCRYSVYSATTQDFATLKETAWELFLRRAGLNIMVARVIANKLLDEYGNRGLAQFLNMPTQEKLARYGHLTGGNRILNSCFKALYRQGI